MQRIKETGIKILPVIGVIVVSILVIFLSTRIFEGGFVQEKYIKGVQYYKGTVEEIVKEDLSPDSYLEEIQIGYQEVMVTFTDGPYKEQTYQIRNPISRLYNYRVQPGTKVVLGVYEQEGTPNISVYSYDRSGTLYVLASLFVFIVVLIGGLKGVKSLVSLIFTFVLILYLMLPMMFRGVDPIVAAILVSILSTVVTLTLVSGINRKTIAAIIGTIVGVIIAGTIAYVAGKLTHLSGFTMEDAESLMYISESSGLRMGGIMFAGILIASLGAVMDVAMSISSSIYEIHSIQPKISKLELFKSAMNIGKDIIGTMTNTLILAFAGGSLSTLILLFAAQMPYNKLINLEVIGIEIIQGLSGSIGIVLAVPITALIGCYFYKGNRFRHLG